MEMNLFYYENDKPPEKIELRTTSDTSTNKEKKYWVIPLATFKNIRKELMDTCFSVETYVTPKIPKYHFDNDTTHFLVPKDKYLNDICSYNEQMVSEPKNNFILCYLTTHQARPLSFSLNDKMTLSLLEDLPADSCLNTTLNLLYEKFPEKFLDKKFGNSSFTRREENTIKFIRTIMKRRYANDVPEIELVPRTTELVSRVPSSSIRVIMSIPYLYYCVSHSEGKPSIDYYTYNNFPLEERKEYEKMNSCKFLYFPK